MTKEKHYPPILNYGEFHCPHCGVFAEQQWGHITGHHVYGDDFYGVSKFNENLSSEWKMSRCKHCSEKIIWLENEIIYPKKMIVDLPNDDLSGDIKKDYLEAANIFSDSPRASAALLRLALQKLCKQLGEKGKNINDDIKELVKKGLNPQIQKSLDILRITGNGAVHPGEINLEEETEKVLKLFELLNFIAEKMITEQKEIDSFYNDLPENSKEAIEKRDEK
ncbi:MAG: DUF4145 domain-containing protein [Candidatus Pacebacteria bacterium]|nr:DUF4145 domain-containing protein [Candidatus Paceibacterota bacterium]